MNAFNFRRFCRIPGELLDEFLWNFRDAKNMYDLIFFIEDLGIKAINRPLKF